MLFDAQRPTLVSTNPPLLVRSQPPTVNRPPPGGASPPLRTILAAMVVAAAMAPRPCSAETYRLEADRKADRVVRVKVVYEVDGQLKLNADGKKVSRLPIDVRAELSYDERLVAADVAPEWAGHSVRHYYQAKANINVGGVSHEPSLRSDRRLLAAQVDRSRQVLSSVQGPLTREELDVLEVPASNMAIHRLLPLQAVEVNQSWEPETAALAVLLGLDVVTESDVTVALKNVKEEIAHLEIGGKLTGSAGGVESKVSLTGKLQFHRQQRQIVWLALAINENRAIGHAVPGFETEARLRMVVAPLPRSPMLPDDVVSSVPTKLDTADTLLDFESTAGRYRMLLDRRWDLMVDRHDMTVMRLVDRGDLLAQCNVSRMPKAPAGKQAALAAFQDEVRQTLGDRFGQFAEASQSTTDRGLQMLRVVAVGVVEEVPIQWTYYLIAGDDGRQTALVFTVQTDLLERFAEADRLVTSSFEYLPERRQEARLTVEPETKPR